MILVFEEKMNICELTKISGMNTSSAHQRRTSR